MATGLLEDAKLEERIRHVEQTVARQMRHTAYLEAWGATSALVDSLTSLLRDQLAELYATRTASGAEVPPKNV